MGNTTVNIEYLIDPVWIFCGIVLSCDQISRQEAYCHAIGQQSVIACAKYDAMFTKLCWQ